MYYARQGPFYIDRHWDTVSMCGVRGTPMEPGLYDCKEQLPYICMNGGNDYKIVRIFNFLTLHYGDIKARGNRWHRN